MLRALGELLLVEGPVELPASDSLKIPIPTAPTSDAVQLPASAESTPPLPEQEVAVPASTASASRLPAPAVSAQASAIGQ